MVHLSATSLLLAAGILPNLYVLLFRHEELFGVVFQGMS